MHSLNGFGVERRLLPLIGVLYACVIPFPSTHAQTPDAQWKCNDVRAMPGTSVKTATLMRGRNHSDIRMYYYQQLANGESTIFGNLVPYDKVWLNDDAAAPIFETESDIMVGTLLVPAGRYSLYFLPSLSGWKLIVNKQVSQRGNAYDEKEDLDRVGMIQAPAAGCEILTLDFGPIPGKACWGRCNPKDGPFIPRDVFGKPLIHLAWAEANVYIVLNSPP
jgi:hypothetical protein